MQTVPSSIDFRGYRVLKASFSVSNEDFCNDEEVVLNPTFLREIQMLSNGNALLRLGVLFGTDNQEGKVPFSLDVLIEGEFSFEDVKNTDEAMKINGVAIMFPYLRSTVSLLTTLMNVSPIILPTINLVRMFEIEEKG